jgi:hypothetical protein
MDIHCPDLKSALFSNTEQDQEGAFQGAAICSLMTPKACKNDGCWTMTRRNAASLLNGLTGLI